MRLFVLLSAVLLSPLTVSAQWRVAVIAGSAASQGDSRDTIDPEHAEIRADAPATITLALSHDANRWRAGIDVHRTSADLSEVSGATAVTTRGVLKAWGAAFEMARRLTSAAEGPALFVAAGAALDQWHFSLTESSPRWRASIRGALQAEFPFGEVWRALVRGQVSVGPSVFMPEELPDDFAQRGAVRAGIAFGMSHRLGGTTRP